eukprot:Gb_15085 [translate_table: standard]
MVTMSDYSDGHHMFKKLIFIYLLQQPDEPALAKVLATRESVKKVGGSNYRVPLGRRDCCTSIMGLNNNAYQISRGTVLNKECSLHEICGFVKGDFMKMPFPDGSFDAVYVIEATCHARDAVGFYKEIKEYQN